MLDKSEPTVLHMLGAGLNLGKVSPANVVATCEQLCGGTFSTLVTVTVRTSMVPDSTQSNNEFHHL